MSYHVIPYHTMSYHVHVEHDPNPINHLSSTSRSFQARLPIPLTPLPLTPQSLLPTWTDNPTSHHPCPTSYHDHSLPTSHHPPPVAPLKVCSKPEAATLGGWDGRECACAALHRGCELAQVPRPGLTLTLTQNTNLTLTLILILTLTLIVDVNLSKFPTHASTLI